jgi:hypothetical protein
MRLGSGPWGRVRRLNEFARAQFFARRGPSWCPTDPVERRSDSIFSIVGVGSELKLPPHDKFFAESPRIFSQRAKAHASALQSARAEAASLMPLLRSRQFGSDVSHGKSTLYFVGRNPGIINDQLHYLPRSCLIFRPGCCPCCSNADPTRPVRAIVTLG